MSVNYVKSFDDGLADLYAREPALDYFEETEVKGYPAVFAGKKDDRDHGLCTLIIGFSNHDAVRLFAQLSGGTDYGRPCEVAKLTAQSVIENLKR